MRASRRPPGPRSLVPGRLPLTFARDRLGFLERMTQQYGDVVFFRLAGSQFAILNHPDHVRDVLVTRQRFFHKGIGLERTKLLLGEGLLTSEDDEHRRRRRLMQPAFHRERIEAYAQTMTGRALRVSGAWRDGQTIDASTEMAAVTMTVAAKTLFDADLDGEVAEIRDALTAAINSFNLALLPFGNHLARLPIPAAIRFRRARAHLDAIIYRLIADRRARPHERGDLISLLVAARDAEGDGGGLADEEIRDEVLTLLLAGYETTANALMWAWYLLSEHPDAERRLHEEIDRVLAGREPGAGDLPALPYTRAVIAESLRLFSPAYLVGRRALAPYDVPGTDYVLPEGTYLFLSQHLLHRDPRFWVEPERFQPERWLGREPHSHKFAYFPFGAGARVCIGEPFAWMEATLVLAAIARRWRLRLVPGHPVVRQPIITLRSRHGMRMTCACRMP